MTTLSSFQSACGWGVGTRRERKAFSVLTFHHFFSPQKQEDMMTMTMRAFSPTVTLTRRKDSSSSSSRSAKCTTTTTTTKACLTTTRTHPFSAPLKASHRRLHIRATNDDDDVQESTKRRRQRRQFPLIAVGATWIQRRVGLPTRRPDANFGRRFDMDRSVSVDVRLVRESRPFRGRACSGLCFSVFQAHVAFARPDVRARRSCALRVTGRF